jgi:DegV family protein with EDD domain
MPPGPVHIVTDSTCDLDPEVCLARNLHVVPLNIHFGSETFRDRVTLRPRQFYERLTTGGPHPTTSQPSPAEFRALYQKLLEEGGEIVSIHISAGMSGTYQSALLAKKDIGSEHIHIRDSGTVSMGLGLIALACSRLAAAGRSAAEIAAHAQTLAEHSAFFFLPETLEYLQKGGRIGRAAALIGSLLNIRPILEVSRGLVGPREKIRGAGRARMRLIELAGDFVRHHSGHRLDCMLGWTGDSTNLDQAIPGFETILDLSTAHRTEIGGVVGTHVGPGAFGIALCADMCGGNDDSGGSGGNGGNSGNKP